MTRQYCYPGRTRTYKGRSAPPSSKLGDFADVADFKEKMKKNLEQEQKNKNKEKKRIATIEAIEKKFVIDLPRGLINAELDRMIADMHERISNAGLKPADYYAELKKTEADILAILGLTP